MRASGVFVSLCLFHLISVSDALAATKTMQCDRYMLDEKGEWTEHFIFRLTADFDRKSVDVKLIKEPEQRKTGVFPYAPGADWKLVWRSEDSLRVVGLVTYSPDNPFSSPAMMLDIDFANLRIKFHEAGGLIDFDTVVSDPWKFRCTRLD